MKTKLIIFFILLKFQFSYSQNFDLKQINNYITNIENNNRGIGGISIFKNGKEIYNRNFGQNQPKNAEFNNETKFQIGSITKTITATLIFKLIENNKLKLDDKLAKFYPQIPNAKKITIKNLLEHTSGLGDYLIKGNNQNWLLKKVSEQEIINEITNQKPLFEPNAKVDYSNSGYYLLCKIVEQLFNKDFVTVVNDEIAEPLNLQNFTATTNETKNIFKTYKYIGYWEEIDEYYFPNIKGVGDISSTMKDLNTFINELFNCKIISETSLKKMKPLKKEIFGKGLMNTSFYNHILYGHGGDTKGFHSAVSYSEEDNYSIALSINGKRIIRNDFMIDIFKIIYNQEFKMPKYSNIELTDTEINTFIGTYSSPTFPLKIKISKEGKILKAQGTNQPHFYLECYEKNKFENKEIGLKIEFNTKENELILKQSDTVKLKKE